MFCKQSPTRAPDKHVSSTIVGKTPSHNAFLLISCAGGEYLICVVFVSLDFSSQSLFPPFLSLNESAKAGKSEVD